MRIRLGIGLTVFVAAWGAGNAWAIDETGWCASSISNVSPRNVLVCDDFDDYCLTPPCGESSSTDNATFLLNWPTDGCLNDDGSPSVATINAEQGGTNYGNSPPFTLRQTKGSGGYPDAKPGSYIFDGTSHGQDLVARIQTLDNTKGSVDGTDENPLILDVYFDLPRPGATNFEAAQTNRYVEITDGSDRAPAEIELVTCPDDGKVRPKISEEARVADRAAIAIGVFAVLDNDGVCDVDSALPLTYQPALYNGNRWYLLKAGAIGPNEPLTDIILSRRRLHMILTVKTSTIDASYQTQNETTLVTVPRGPTTANGFAGMHVGNGACLPDGAFSQVDGLILYGGVLGPAIATGACCLEGGQCAAAATQAGCLGQLAGAYAGDGVDCETANCLTPPGGCCLPNGSCIEVDQTTCEQEPNNGVFNGALTTCAETACCPDPFADADGDGDVDMTDFAKMQACITVGTGGPPPDGCECFDQVIPFGTIDADDVERFILCGSGPELAADACCDGGPGCAGS